MHLKCYLVPYCKMLPILFTPEANAILCILLRMVMWNKSELPENYKFSSCNYKHMNTFYKWDSRNYGYYDMAWMHIFTGKRDRNSKLENMFLQCSQFDSFG